MKRIFYICSFGGSGSKMLCSYLKNFGKTYHIHSRRPPKKLTSITNPKNSEWFGEDILPIEENKKTTVIFIYRNPVDAILSRFYGQGHLGNIQTDPTTTIEDVVLAKEDLYGVDEFFNNYVKAQCQDYDIYCVKYEEIFDKIEELDKALGLPSHSYLHPVKKESKYKWGTKIDKRYDLVEPLTEIYKNLIHKMDNMPFIKLHKGG